MDKLKFIDTLDKEQSDNAVRVAQMARNAGVDPTLAVAIAFKESGLRTNPPRGASGEIGMMQVMPSTGLGLGYDEEKLSIPNQNIKAGIEYLKLGLQASENDPTLAAIYYNGGPGAVDALKLGKDPDPRVFNYVRALNGYGTFDTGPKPAQQSESDLVLGNAPPPPPPPPAVQSAMDEQEKRQAQLVGGGVGVGIAGTKVFGTGAGAVVQAVANRAGQGFSAGMQTNAPPVSPLGQPPTGPTSGEKWAAKTGYGKGAGTVQDVSSRFQRSIGQGPVSGRMDKLWGPALAGENPQLTQRLIDRAKAAEAAKIPPKVSGLDWITGKFADMFRPVSSAVSTVAKYGLPPIALASAAGEGVNIAQQLRKPEDQRDPTSMLLSGANILGSGMMFTPAAPLGAAIAGGSAAAQAYRNSPDAQAYVRKKMQGLADVPLLDEMTGPLP